MQTTQSLSAGRTLRLDAVRLGVPALAGALLLMAVAFVALRVAIPTDGAVGAYVTSSWSADGLRLERLPGSSSALRGGDTVTMVAGRTPAAWLAGTLDRDPSRPATVPGATLEYVVMRDGALTGLTETLVRYPLAVVLLANWSTLAWALVMATVGIYLFARRPEEAATRALLVLGTGVLASSVPWMLGLGAADLVAGGVLPLLYLAATFAVYLLFWSAALHFALAFPQPIFGSGRQPRAVALAYALPMSLQAAWALATLSGSPDLLAWIGGWTIAQLVIVPTVIATMLGLLVVQWRRASALDRPGLRGIMWASMLAIVGVLLGWYLPQSLLGTPLLPWSAIGLPGLAFPLALGLAVGRGRLFGIESLLHRSMVYGGLTVGILLVYAASVVLLSTILPGDGPYAVQLIAIGTAALVALPLRDRLQRSVSRLLYGDRDEPQRAIARLGARLEASLDPGTVLPMVAETVAEALRLPYAAIELGRDGSTVVAAAHGTRHDDVVRLPLVHQGEEIGWLALAQRAPDEPFSPADRALLTQLARQAGAAAYSVRLTAELQRSRQQLVAAREEERRRLRRDLHDGVGPALAGTLMKLEAARSAGPGAAQVDRLLADLAAQTRRAIDDIRRVASDLRPPALDQLGLVGALEQDATRLCPGDCTFHLELPARLADLPAAVEVAAYRIGLEALTNVAHHAAATNAWLRLEVAATDLVVEVRDDGAGVDGPPRPGIGLTSMRERADELGGDLVMGRGPEGGFLVRARLPLAAGVGHA